jgi:hypothetical protein
VRDDARGGIAQTRWPRAASDEAGFFAFAFDDFFFLAADTSELVAAGWPAVACVVVFAGALASRAAAVPTAIAEPARNDATRREADIVLSI